MAKRASGRRSKKRQTGSSRFSLRWFVLTLVLGFGVLLGLVLLVRWADLPGGQRLPQKKSDHAVAKDPEALARAEVEFFLASLELSSRNVERDLDDRPYRYQVHGPYPSQTLLDGLAHQLQRRSPEFGVRQDPAGRRLSITRGGEDWLTVAFLPEPANPPVELPSGPRVAIIMDDLGRSLYPAQVLLELSRPITFAILPGEPYAGQIAEMAHAAGREVMLHAPMEPQGYPAVKPGPDALMVGYDDLDIQSRFRGFLERVPHVIGVNNHMGSRFTEDRRAMGAVMEVVRERGMFFVDSLTTGRSTVSEVAKRFQVPHIERNVFLDNVAEVEAITGQVRKLAALARSRGQAVGICHPYPETLEALRREVPKLTAQGVEVIPISLLLGGREVKGPAAAR